MSTPGFTAQDSNSLTTVRFYTPLDPYYYSVDNRPLQDLDSNITAVSSGGGDSARRAALLTQISMSDIFRNLFSTSNTNGFVTGFNVSYPGSNTVQVGPGGWYQSLTLSSVDTTPLIKQALNFKTQSFSVIWPTIAGQSVNYLVQMAYSDLVSANMATSTLPYLDANNSFLPCLLLNGECKLSIKVGTDAATGSQLTPTPDTNNIGLYVITLTYGGTLPIVAMYSSAPDRKGLLMNPQVSLLPAASASYTSVGGFNTLTYTKDSIQGAAVGISLSDTNLSSQDFPNPYLPIKVKVVYSSDITGGNFAFTLKYAGSGLADTNAPTLIQTSIETVPNTSPANSISTYTFTTINIPPTAFSGFTSGALTILKKKLFAVLEREAVNASDTATGQFFLHDIIIYQ